MAAKIFDAVSLAEVNRYAPRERYIVYYLHEGEWKRAYNDKLISEFRRQQTARFLQDDCEKMPGVEGTMMTKHSSVYYSDIATKAVYEVTELSVMLV